ncbi:MAG: ribosome maturation factor RimM [Bacilli bacterium]
MTYIFIGTIVNTHGIKGEVRISSDVEYKKLIFKSGMKIYIGNNHEELIISKYRYHKIYDMVIFEDLNDINEVICFKGEKVFINKDDIQIEGYFDEDYIGLLVHTDHLIGEVIKVLNNNGQKLLLIKGKNRNYYIPKVDDFINKIDLEKKCIYINEIPGLIDED